MECVFTSKEANKRSWNYVREAFSQVYPYDNRLTLCYAYRVKLRLFSRAVCNYALGFNPHAKEIVLIPLSAAGSIIGSTIRITKDDIFALGKTPWGSWKITSSLPQSSLTLHVPADIPDSAEDSGLFPIKQREEAEQFEAMMMNILSQYNAALSFSGAFGYF